MTEVRIEPSPSLSHCVMQVVGMLADGLEISKLCHLHVLNYLISED